MDQPSTLTTAFVTSVGATFAPALVVWAKTKGIDLSSPDAEKALAGLVAVAIGSGSGWVTAILDSFVGAVVASNNAAASLVSWVGGLGKKGAPAATAAPAAPVKAAGFARMGMLAVLLVLAIPFALPSCGVSPLSTGATQGASELQVKAQQVINEGYRLLASADKEIGQAAADRIWTPDESQKYLNQAILYRKKLDDAQKVLNGGSIEAALSQASVTQAVADALLQEVLTRAAAARKAKSGSMDASPGYILAA